MLTSLGKRFLRAPRFVKSSTAPSSYAKYDSVRGSLFPRGASLINPFTFLLEKVPYDKYELPPLALCSTSDGANALDFSVEKSPAKGASKKNEPKVNSGSFFLITTKNYDHNFMD